MKRFSHSILTAVLSLSCTLVAISSCSDDVSTDNNAISSNGELGLSLELPSGHVIERVAYFIEQGGREIARGELALGGATEILFRIAGLPAGTGYTIRLEAHDADSTVNCSGQAGFSILAFMVTSVYVPLNCRSELDIGDADIHGRVNQCPELSAVVAAPNHASIGETIALSGSARDADGDALTLRWRNGDANLALGSNALFDCSEAGTYTLTFSASDEECETERSIEVLCAYEDRCGNGVLDPGEDCDDGNREDGDAYPANCSMESGTCGDAVIEAAEECDDGNDVDLDGCTRCRLDWSNPECFTCMDEQCGDMSDFGFDIAGEICRANDFECQEGLACIVRTECMDDERGLIACVCGDVTDVADCIDPENGLDANGPCLDEFLLSTGSSIELILEPLSAPLRAGLAYQCMADTCAVSCLED